MSPVAHSAESLRHAANEECRTAAALQDISTHCLGDVRERIEILAELHRKRAEVYLWCAGQFEKIAARSAVAS